ncbi:FAD:protein FMN transferase [Pseudoduganella sp. OTU4001]|uniref:FAD:protein FMN transferase n=1 Tax=Pseudoduganella sp. OTU4001 TaxID=3043854 RepID=UPI00313AFAB1
MVNWAVEFSAMASPCQVMLCAPSEGAARTLAQPAIDEVLRIERAFSRYRPASIVGRINASAGSGEWIALDAEAAGLLDYAAQLHVLSDGLFDITSGVLRRAWDFRTPRVPSASELEPLLALVGWQHVERRAVAGAAQVRLQLAGMELDFGGFGKEYAADRAAAILQAQGLRHGYVNLGGDLRVFGPQADDTPWSIGIQDPRDEQRTIASIEVASGALATSGDYERYFELDGQRYCHILNPRTGMPVTYWRSVSVLAPLAVAAGSASTIAMLLGEDARCFLDASGFAWLAQDNGGRIFDRR